MGRITKLKNYLIRLKSNDKTPHNPTETSLKNEFRYLKTPIQLENERVLLIPFSNQRHQELKDIIFDADIWKFMGMDMKYEKDFDTYINNTLEDAKNGHSYLFLILDKLNNRIAGSSRYGHINTAS